MIIKFIAAKWWFMYGNQTHTLRKLAIKVLSQTTSSSACERIGARLLSSTQSNEIVWLTLDWSN